MQTQLTSEMQRALALIKEHGSLCRYGRGFWREPNAPLEGKTGSGKTASYFPLDYIDNSTVTSLIHRGLIVATEFKTNSQPGYHTPIKVTLP